MSAMDVSHPNECRVSDQVLSYCHVCMCDVGFDITVMHPHSTIIQSCDIIRGQCYLYLFVINRIIFVII